MLDYFQQGNKPRKKQTDIQEFENNLNQQRNISGMSELFLKKDSSFRTEDMTLYSNFNKEKMQQRD